MYKKKAIAKVYIILIIIFSFGIYLLLLKFKINSYYYAIPFAIAFTSILNILFNKTETKIKKRNNCCGNK